LPETGPSIKEPAFTAVSGTANGMTVYPRLPIRLTELVTPLKPLEAMAQGRMLVASDVGGAKMARGFAKRLNATLAIIDKRRPSANVAEVVNVVGEVKGKDVIIPDDMIDTGGTMSEAIHALKRLGAEDIYCCATHGLLSGPAIERLRNSPVTEVAVANTVLLPPDRNFDRLKVLSIAPLLAKAIGYTHSDQSVRSLFD
jgi:ribose-phosphate pyrophosphokinase